MDDKFNGSKNNNENKILGQDISNSFAFLCKREFYLIGGYDVIQMTSIYDVIDIVSLSNFHDVDVSNSQNLLLVNENEKRVWEMTRGCN